MQSEVVRKHRSLLFWALCFHFYFVKVESLIFYTLTAGKTCFIQKWILAEHDKTNKMTCVPSKETLILGISPDWSKFSLSAWRGFGSYCIYPLTRSEDWTDNRCSVWPELDAQVILLVLSCSGSDIIILTLHEYRCANKAVIYVHHSNLFSFLIWAHTHVPAVFGVATCILGLSSLILPFIH